MSCSQMRKIISNILLLFVLFQLAGYLLIFKTQQFQIRKDIKYRIKAGIPDDELVLITIQNSLLDDKNPIFQWIHKKEFRYNGNMFDIVRKQVYMDSTQFYCLSDHQETQLFANLEYLVKKEMAQNSEQKQQRERASQLLNSLYFSQTFHPNFINSSQEIEFLDYYFRLKTWINAPNIPPPKV